MKKHLNTLIAGAAALALAGCMVGPDYVPPTAEIAKQDLSEEHFFRDDGLWKEAAPAESLPKGDWWKIFNDPVLNSLLEQCKKNNPSLSAAFYRVEQARQNARMDEAQLYQYNLVRILWAVQQVAVDTAGATLAIVFRNEVGHACEHAELGYRDGYKIACAVHGYLRLPAPSSRPSTPSRPSSRPASRPSTPTPKRSTTPSSPGFADPFSSPTKKQ